MAKKAEVLTKSSPHVYHWCRQRSNVGTSAGISEHPSPKTGLLAIDSIAIYSIFEFLCCILLFRATSQEVFILGSDLYRTKQGSQLPCEGFQDNKFSHINAIWLHDCYRLQQKLTAAGSSRGSLFFLWSSSACVHLWRRLSMFTVSG